MLFEVKYNKKEPLKGIGNITRFIYKNTNLKSPLGGGGQYYD